MTAAIDLERGLSCPSKAAGLGRGVPVRLDHLAGRPRGARLPRSRARLLLQLAHPWVATAIAEHSTALSDPIGRFHRTFEIVFTLVFGSLEQALATSRRYIGVTRRFPDTYRRGLVRTPKALLIVPTRSPR